MVLKLNPDNVLRRATAELRSIRNSFLEASTVGATSNVSDLGKDDLREYNRMTVLIGDLWTLRRQLKKRAKR